MVEAHREKSINLKLNSAKNYPCGVWGCKNCEDGKG